MPLALLAWMLAGAVNDVAAANPEGVWLSAELGGGYLDRDVVAGGAVGVGLETAPFALHLSLPLTLRLLDLAPASPASTPSTCRVIRCQEWLDGDELSVDAVSRVVDELRIARPGDPFHARGGGLFATQGRGRLIARYTNAADWDRRAAGAFVEGNVPWHALTLTGVTGHLLRPHEMFGARAQARVFVDDDGEPAESLLERLTVGLELAGDAAAPIAPSIDDDGDLLPGSAARPLLGASVDVGWPLLDGTGLQLEPWLALSTLTGLPDVDGGAGGVGVGGAAGIEGTADLIFVALRAGGELVVDGPRHRSAPFGTLYDVERKRVIGARAAPLGLVELGAAGGVGGGGFIETVVLRIVRAGARVHVDGGVPEASRAEAFLEVATGPLNVGARALQRLPLDEALLGDDVFVVVEGAWNVIGPVSLLARWRHAPRFHAGVPRADDDIYAAVSVDVVLQ